MPRPVVPMALAPRAISRARSSAGDLAGAVQGHVVGQDQGAGVAYLEPVAHGHPAGLQAADLRQQGVGGEHHAVANVAGDAGAEDPGRDQVQNGLLAADDQGVAGVVPALEAHDAVRPLGEQVDDLALALVTPLGPDDDYVLSHVPHLPLGSGRPTLQAANAGPGYGPAGHAVNTSL